MEAGFQLSDLGAVVQLRQLHVPPVQLVDGVQHGVDMRGDLLKLVAGIQPDLVIHIALLDDAQLVVERLHGAGIAAGDLPRDAEQCEKEHAEHQHSAQAADDVIGAPVPPLQQCVYHKPAHRGLPGADHILLAVSGEASLSRTGEAVEVIHHFGIAGHHDGAAGIRDHIIVGQASHGAVPFTAVQQQEGITQAVQLPGKQQPGTAGRHVVNGGIDIRALRQPRDDGLAEVQQMAAGLRHGGKGRGAVSVQQKQVTDPVGGVTEAVELIGHVQLGDLSREEGLHDRHVVPAAQIVGAGQVGVPECLGELAVVLPVLIVGVALGIDGQQHAKQQQERRQEHGGAAGDLRLQPFLKAGRGVRRPFHPAHRGRSPRRAALSSISAGSQPASKGNEL